MASSEEETGEDASDDAQRLLLAGLDRAGKTVMLYKLKFDENVSSVPTIGFNVESLNFKGITYDIWDLGGADKMRPLWKHYLHDLAGIIWAVDSADRARVSESRQELHKLMNTDELKGVNLLVYANKQDLPNAMNKDEGIQELDLHAFTNDSKWHVQPSTTTTGDGLQEGLNWLVEHVKVKAKRTEVEKRTSISL